MALILLLAALGSLAVANLMFEGSPGQKDSVMTLEGNVTEIKETAKGGNLMIHIDSSDLTIFVPESSEAADVKLRMHEGDRIRAKGGPSDCQGKKKLMVERVSDLELTERNI